MDFTQKMLKEIHSLPNSTKTLLLSLPCSSCSGHTGLLASPPTCQVDVRLMAFADPVPLRGRPFFPNPQLHGLHIPNIDVNSNFSET